MCQTQLGLSSVSAVDPPEVIHEVGYLVFRPAFHHAHKPVGMFFPNVAWNLSPSDCKQWQKSYAAITLPSGSKRSCKAPIAISNLHSHQHSADPIPGEHNLASVQISSSSCDHPFHSDTLFKIGNQSSSFMAGFSPVNGLTGSAFFFK